MHSCCALSLSSCSLSKKSRMAQTPSPFSICHVYRPIRGLVASLPLDVSQYYKLRCNARAKPLSATTPASISIPHCFCVCLFELINISCSNNYRDGVFTWVFASFNLRSNFSGFYRVFTLLPTTVNTFFRER